MFDRCNAVDLMRTAEIASLTTRTQSTDLLSSRLVHPLWSEGTAEGQILTAGRSPKVRGHRTESGGRCDRGVSRANGTVHVLNGRPRRRAMASARVMLMSSDDVDAELSIGQVATMSRLTIRALRHSDEIGLLRPARVDPSSGYRYYTPEQVTIAATISLLRGLDIDTTTIGALLAATIDVDVVIEHELHRLARIEQQRRDALDMLRSLTTDAAMTTPTVVHLDAFSILGKRTLVPVSDDVALVGKEFDELFSVLKAASIEHDGDGICVIQRTERDELWLDLGVRTEHSVEIDGYDYFDIEAAPTATLVHHGPLSSLPLGHARLSAWAHNNGLRSTGPARETYLGRLEDQRTEIALPVSDVR